MTAAAASSALPAAAAELRRGDSLVRVSVGPGAPITAFVAGGRNWCADRAWQDYAPTSAHCALPTFVAGAAGATFPDGGLLAAEEPTIDVQADGSAGSITTWWPPSPYPLGWTRVVTLDADGTLRVRHTVTNAQRAPLPFVWGMPVFLPWDAGVSIDIPRGARSRVAVAYGEGVPPAGSEFAWPSLREGGRLVDLTEPGRLGARSAVLCFVELPQHRFVVRVGNAGIEVSGSPGVLSHARVWINNDADSPDAAPRAWWRRRAQVRELSVAPSVGAPSQLSDAVGAWGAARWVNPGETVQWDLRVRSVSPAA